MKKIAFISFEQHYYEKHQFYCLAAYLKSKKFAVSYISENNFHKAISRIKEEKPDCLGYSTLSANSKIYIEFDKVQKKVLNLKSIVGGPSAIFNPDFFTDITIDGICLGEGEEALVQFLQTNGVLANNTIIKGNVSSVEYNPLVNLDQMPFPDREIVYEKELYLKRMRYRMFLSGRGCPYDCTYCHNHIFNKRFKDYGKIVRKKSVGYFIEEIKQANEKYNPQLIVMQDDTFIIDKEWLFEFTEEYKRHINKPFACNIRANLVNEEIIKILKQAGCICCVWSIETGNDMLRNLVLKRNISREQIIRTADLLNKYKIKHRIGNLVGLPHETYENIQETIELNIRCKPHLSLMNTLIAYPGLEIADYAIKTGYLRSDYINNLPDVFWTMSILNFSWQDKVKFLKTTYLFPLFVSYPVLYRNKIIRTVLYKFPIIALKYIHALTDMRKMSTLYPFKASFMDIITIVCKYLEYTITHQVIDKKYNLYKARSTCKI